MSCSLNTKPSSFLNSNFPMRSLSSLLGQTVHFAIGPASFLDLLRCMSRQLFKKIVIMYENFIHLPFCLPGDKSHLFSFLVTSNRYLWKNFDLILTYGGMGFHESSRS